ncbi:YggT family protein [Sneathiella limimaris]|uniref:YggT family protein n=1 Tax=Sneathiella limimaris TaxID=1964213 RepID=UPI00146C65B3|nr:YggT family protein [Sneathiella limimaris]
MQSLVVLVSTVIEIYVWLLIANAIMSWLIAFNVINTQNQFVSTVGQFLYRITEPLLRPLRQIIPSIGGLDVTPIVLILLLYFIRNLMWEFLVAY